MKHIPMATEACEKKAIRVAEDQEAQTDWKWTEKTYF